MKLSELQAAGAFVSAKPIKREIKVKRPDLKPKEEWADPDVAEFTGETIDDSLTAYIRRGAAIDAIEMMRAEERDQPFVAIHRSVCHEDGRPVFDSLEQASSLALWLAMPLFEAITEVANAGPKSSRRKTSSGSKPASLTASQKQS
jgi:hypothetical protein